MASPIGHPPAAANEGCWPWERLHASVFASERSNARRTLAASSTGERWQRASTSYSHSPVQIDIEGESLATQRKFPGALWKHEAAYTISAERLANGGRTAGPYRRDFSKIS